MKKIWFIVLKEKKEGPFSIIELKRDIRITPDTLVWKEGFSNWKKMREVEELKEVFSDENENPKKTDDLIDKPCLIITPQDEIILDLQKEPPYLLWILIVLLLLLYVTFQFFWVR
ncbi:MAG: DUF4339 domain-containing protein [Parachlamydiaceae bacterium]|nr:DUF4339 domain-containing protein [Parachlamydiaceae bacterium]